MRWLLLTALTLLLSGCALTGDGRCTYLAPGVSYCLLPPDQGAAQRQIQKIGVKVADAPRLVLHGAREQRPGELVLAATGAAGQVSLALRWDGHQLESRSQGLPQTLDPAWLLALVQLSEAPLPRVEGALSGGRLTESQGQGGRQRTLWQGSEPLLTLEQTPRGSRFEHHKYGLIMTIDTLSQEAL